MNSNNIISQEQAITKEKRVSLINEKPCVLWFTGLSASGKSTLANEVEKKLFDMRIKTYLLDGDNIRLGLNKDLAFSKEDREENIRRIGEVSKLFVDAGVIVLTAFISPFLTDRQIARDLLEEGEFIEIFVDTPIKTCEQRDPKGLYKKARDGQIKDFTGIDSPYEKSRNPEIKINTDKCSIDESVNIIIQYLIKFSYIKEF